MNILEKIDNYIAETETEMKGLMNQKGFDILANGIKNLNPRQDEKDEVEAWINNFLTKLERIDIAKNDINTIWKKIGGPALDQQRNEALSNKIRAKLKSNVMAFLKSKFNK